MAEATITKAEMYMQYLQREGYHPELDDDGDVRFRCEGKTLILFAHETQRSLFRLALPWFWSVDDEEERVRALEATNAVMRRVALVKVFLANTPEGEHTWVTCEMLIDPFENFELVFDSCVDAVMAARREFCRVMNDAEGDQ